MEGTALLFDLAATLLLAALGYALYKAAYAEGYKADRAAALADEPDDRPIVMEHTHGGEEDA